MSKKIIFTILTTLVIFTLFSLKETKAEEVTLNVYNWGEYIDEDVIDLFEDAYNVNVNYETFESNELMYQKLITPGTNYDVIIPSDYMIERLIKEDLLLELDKTKLSNYNNIDLKYLQASETFDQDNKYAVPYFWGTVGILYNKTKVTQQVDSWSILWDAEYENRIFMYNSQRDSLMVALRLLGKSMNTTNMDDLNLAKEKLIEQIPLVYSYVTDSVIQQMITGEADLAVVYSGDAAYIMSENEDMEFALPKEGTNFWIDSMVIPKKSQNVDLAHKFIDFMCSEDIGLKNTEYVMYSSPITTVFNEVITEDWANNVAYNPDGIIDVMGGDIETEVFRDPSDFITEYDKVWQEVLASSQNDGSSFLPIIAGVIFIGVSAYFIYKNRKKIREM